jgi:hypothetical protein
VFSLGAGAAFVAGSPVDSSGVAAGASSFIGGGASFFNVNGFTLLGGTGRPDAPRHTDDPANNTPTHPTTNAFPKRLMVK